ncbi:MAG: alanine--glyoxylate aminotransferase family protein, partial [Phycisphaerae bacterium]
MAKQRLFTPGPTMVPEEVMLEMARPQQHHRTADFRDMLRQVTEHLKYVFQTTDGTPLVFTGSGTAAMEAVIVGCCAPGKKALVLHAGKFGERWRDICKRFRIEHAELTLRYGQGFKAGHVAEALAKDDGFGCVIFVHSETSTAAVSDAQAVARVARDKGLLVIVDGITSVGALPFKMDDWGIDAAVTGSQKALMLPPGLGVACIGPRAWAAADAIDPPAYYNSLKAYRKSLGSFDTPYTPNNQLIRGLLKGLTMIREEGLENVWSRTAKLAAGTRAAVKALKLELFAADPGDSVTAIKVPVGVDEARWRKDMKSRFGIHCAGGQGDMK